MASSLFDVVRQRAKEVGQVVAAVDAIRPDGDEGTAPPTRLTYAALCEAAERLAGALTPWLEQWRADENAALATWMCRGNSWYCVFCAASRLQVPLVALSRDLPDKAVELQRNREILAAHRPAVVVADSFAEFKDTGLEELYYSLASGSVVEFPTLWARAQCEGRVAPEVETSADATLCYCYTGGTTKASRCARISHRMALHEVAAYRHIADLGRKDRILQQHSLYWAASAYGEVDIALAYGCALVFCEAWDVDGLVSAIRANEVTCSGLVPSLLAAIEPRDVPSLQLVFTWGEALQPHVAREWARQVHLVDLLISTECWLSLYADWSRGLNGRAAACNGRAGPGSAEQPRPVFKTVPNTKIRLRPVAMDEVDGHRDSNAASAGSVRRDLCELLVAGPMVSVGYTDAALNASSFEVGADGIRWYCTRDCVEQCGDDGVVFAGRADDCVKVGGVWVDVRELEARLAGIDGVSDVCICNQNAFIVLHALRDGLIPLQAALPSGFALYIVPALPRNPGTGKVDRQRLWRIVGSGIIAEREHREAQLCTEELAQMVKWYRPLVVVGGMVLIHAGLTLVRGGRTLVLPVPQSGGLVAMALQFGFQVVLELSWRLPCMSYMVLLNWHYPSISRQWCVRNFPFGVYGLAQVICGVLPNPKWGALVAAPGMYLAARRGRLVSWPLVCAVGFPVWARDAGYWMQDRGWRGVARWYADMVLSKGQGACGVVVAGCTGAKWRVKRFLGLARKCKWCKKHHSAWAGHINKAQDPFWYCERCWTVFNRHQQCSKCKDWAVQGQMSNASGSFICSACESPGRGAGDGAAAPGAVASTSAAGSSAAGSSGGHSWGRKRPYIQRRWVTLKSSDDAALGSSAAWPADDGTCGEPPRSRQRTDEPLSPSHHATTNGIAHDTPDRPAGDGAHPPARARQESVPNGSSHRVSKSKEWKIIERATGMTFDSLDDSLLSLDSLRYTKMTSALRREAGKRVSRETLKRSPTLGNLLGEIEKLPEERHCPVGSLDSRSKDREHAVWGMMWHSKCQWVIRRKQPLSEAVLRVALRQLVGRHDALRAELRDPYRLFGATQKAFTAFEVWRRHGPPIGALKKNGGRAARVFGHAANRAARALGRATCWSFRRAWPRAGTSRVPPNGPAAQLPLRVLPHSPTMEDAEFGVWRAGSQFTPPFRVTLAPFGEGEDEGALLHMAVTHMLSDGYSVVPLLNDLAHLVTQAEREARPAELGGSAPAPESAAVLPPLPSMLAAIEPRLMQTINGADNCSGADDAPLVGGGITHEPVGQKWGPDAFTVFVTVEPAVVAAIRQAAHRLAVPEDIAMLTILGITLAWFEGNKLEPIAMIVPQRDGPAENDMVGLFADIRHLTVHTEGMNFAGVAMHLHRIVKERLWCAPGIATQFDLALVNFEWTDFDESHGFAQHVNLYEGNENARHPLKVAVEQPDRDTWRMRVGFHCRMYDDEQRNLFFEMFERSLHTLLEDPLKLVWPEDGYGHC